MTVNHEIASFFRTEKGAVDFVPSRSAPALR